MATLWQRSWQRWLDRRIPKQRQVQLNQRRIFIFPSRQGAYFLGVLLLLLIAAINYQNNLIYLLLFSLLSLMNSAILFNYFNLSGLQLEFLRAQPSFAGDVVAFTVRISRSHSRFYHRLALSWPKQTVSFIDLLEQDRAECQVYCQSQQRGLFKPGRLLLESYYPLGLIRCWTWVDLDFSAVVYPKPEALSTKEVHHGDGDDGLEKPSFEAEDFFGFRSYQAGDSLRHVDWRSLARGLPLQSKVYAKQSSQELWVDWHALQGVPTEQRLSQLCFWALTLEKEGAIWGLRLPQQDIAPAQGERHLQQVLTALALFEVEVN